MAATDVSDALQVALRASGLDQADILHRPRLLSDNSPSYVAGELGDWLKSYGIPPCPQPALASASGRSSAANCGPRAPEQLELRADI